MNIREKRAAFEKNAKIYESGLLNFHGVDGFDVYNCSIPFLFQDKEYMFGRIERRSEWARSWVGLFQKIDQQNYQKVGDTLYTLEDPCVQKIGDEFIMEGTHVKKRANEKIESFFAYFHRGTDIHDLHYFATGPDNMKDVRLVPLQDGRIGVFSRPRGEAVLKKYGSEAVIGFGIIDSLDQLTEERIENARVIDGLFDQNEWGGCNQCYALRDGRIGVIGHQSYFDKRDGVNLSVYLNIAFIFDPDTFKATDPQVIAVRSSYPKTAAKTPELVDCAFTSGIVKRSDGLVTLYSGLSDCAEGYVVIPNPFGDLL